MCVSLYTYERSACACSFDVTATLVSPPWSVSHRGLLNTIHRDSRGQLSPPTLTISQLLIQNIIIVPQYPYSPSPLRALVSRRYSNEHHHHQRFLSWSARACVPVGELKVSERNDVYYYICSLCKVSVSYIARVRTDYIDQSILRHVQCPPPVLFWLRH